MISICVPCFNEERRLDEAELHALVAGGAALVLVDDGSTDGTLAKLQAFAARVGAEQAHVLALAHNVGKGEAVRAGMRAGIERGASIVGYVDADFATPAAEMLRIVEVLRADPLLVAAIGARIARLGAHIERSAARHYAGRVFATAASSFLGVPVYDTQCGAKAFRVDDVLRDALASPFASRWIFDVELLDRVLAPDRSARARRIAEVPLTTWRDVKGSKVKPADIAVAAAHLAKLALRRR